VTSVHKNLGSLSGTALINIGKNSRLSADLVKEIYIMLSTTSPSPYLLFDVEGCVRLMLDDGNEKLKDRLVLRNLLKTLLKQDANDVMNTI
jgi:arginine/lysine/ornithine decarboxylase